jgi:hypothetical protein
MQRCDARDYREVNNKVHVDKRLRDLHLTVQGALSL